MINISKEITLLNKEKILSALYQLKSEVSKQDLAELLGIDNRNITRYFKGYVEAGLIKKWFVPTGKTRMVILEITPDGIKEAKKLPIQISLTVIPDKEPDEPEPEKPTEIEKSELAKTFLNALDSMYALKKDLRINNDKYYEMSWNNFQSFINSETRKIYKPAKDFYYDKTRSKSEIQIEREAEALKDLNDLKQKILLYKPYEPEKKVPKEALKKPLMIKMDENTIFDLREPVIPTVIISKEKKKLKFELMTYCSKLPIRQVDYKIFGFTSSAQMRAKIMMLISEL